MKRRSGPNRGAESSERLLHLLAESRAADPDENVLSQEGDGVDIDCDSDLRKRIDGIRFKSFVGPVYASVEGAP